MKNNEKYRKELCNNELLSLISRGDNETKVLFETEDEELLDPEMYLENFEFEDEREIIREAFFRR